MPVRRAREPYPKVVFAVTDLAPVVPSGAAYGLIEFNGADVVAAEGGVGDRRGAG
jgi:hypothetical protein